VVYTRSTTTSSAPTTGSGSARSTGGKGHGQDAVRTLVAYGFEHLNLAKISLQVLADDERAVGAYRKVGFVEEGRLRAHAWYEGARHDELVMSVLREEWTPPVP
jgi:RimJ/RimL family protein N-acetyltransferase